VFISGNGGDAARTRRSRWLDARILSTTALLTCCGVASAQQAPIQLDTIHVTSPTLTSTPEGQTASSVTVITSEQLERDQRRTVADALETVPGLNVVQTGGPGGLTSVFLRGTNSNHVKVLIDGIDVSDPSSGSASFDFGQLLTGDIERIEVLRGPQSGLYGSDAIGGVISITTKQGSGPPKVTASVEGGSFGTTREQVGVSGSQGDFSYAFNLQHFQSVSVPVTPLIGAGLLPGEQRNNDFYDNWTASTKMSAKLSDTFAVNVVARYTDSTLRSTGENILTIAPEAFQSTQTDHNFFGRLEGVWSPTNGFKNYFGLNYTNEYTWIFDPNPDTGFSSPLVSPASTTIGTRLKEDYRGEVQVAPGHLVTFGAEHQNETLTTNSTASVDFSQPQFPNGIETFFNTNAQRNSNAGWLQLQDEITRQFTLVSNVRYDDFDTFGGHTTWRIAPVYVVPDTNTKLKASYGTGFKAPPLFDLFVSFPGEFVANPNLKPEESRGWDVGFEQPIAANRFRFGTTFFHNDVTNLINGAAAPGGLFTEVNIGAATMYGVESFASWKVTNNLDLRADYTNTTAKDDSTGMELVRRPKNKASITAAWQPIDRLTLSSTVLYVGSWLDLDRSGILFPCSPGQPSTCVNAAPFTTVNLAINYKASDTVNYFMRVDNLFNKQYEDPIGFLRPGIAVYGGVRLTGMPGG